jgi:NADH-quinone oxidoreductase subunit C
MADDQPQPAPSASAAGETEPGAAGTDPSGDKDLLFGCPLTESLGDAVVHTDVDRYGGLMAALKADGYEMLCDLTAVDYLSFPPRSLPEGIKPERFEVVVHVQSMSRHLRLRVRCQVPGDDPTVVTMFDLWQGSEAFEREVFDMFGIRFDGHPDLTRILMPEDWEGHPLRKDYAVGKVPVQFKEAPTAR